MKHRNNDDLLRMYAKVYASCIEQSFTEAEIELEEDWDEGYDRTMPVPTHHEEINQEMVSLRWIIRYALGATDMDELLLICEEMDIYPDEEESIMASEYEEIYSFLMKRHYSTLAFYMLLNTFHLVANTTQRQVAKLYGKDEKAHKVAVSAYRKRKIKDEDVVDFGEFEKEAKERFNNFISILIEKYYGS